MKTPKAVQQWEALKQQVCELAMRQRRSKYQVSYSMSVGVARDLAGNDFRFGHSQTEHFRISFSGPAKPLQGCLMRVQNRFLPFRQQLIRTGIPFVDLYDSSHDEAVVCQTLVVIAPEVAQRWYNKARIEMQAEAVRRLRGGSN